MTIFASDMSNTIKNYYSSLEYLLSSGVIPAIRTDSTYFQDETLVGLFCLVTRGIKVCINSPILLKTFATTQCISVTFVISYQNFKVPDKKNHFVCFYELKKRKDVAIDISNGIL